MSQEVRKLSENLPHVKERIVFSSTDFKEMLSDSFALKYLEFVANPQTRELLKRIKKATDEAYDLFGTPTNNDDAIQIRNFIINTLNGIDLK